MKHTNKRLFLPAPVVMLLICLFGLVFSYLVLLPNLVFPVEKIQVEVIDNTIYVIYDDQIINSAQLDSTDQIQSATITVNHDSYYSFRYIYPNLVDKYSVLDLENNTQENIQKKVIIKNTFSRFAYIFNPYSDMFIAENRYPNNEYSTIATNVRLPQKFRLNIATTNVHDVNIEFNKHTRISLRPQWHYENVIHTSNEKAHGQSINFIDIPIQFSKILYSHIFGFFLIMSSAIMLALLFIPIKRLLFNRKFVVHAFISPQYLIIAISVLFIAATIFISTQILQSIPHTQDEVVYLFQSKIFASGKLFAESLPEPYNRFFEHEFIINNGKWFGKYPPGTSLLFALSQLFSLPFNLNNLFGTASLIFTYLISKKLYSQRVGILATLLFALSPFHLLISSSYLSHPAALLMILASTYFILSKRFFISGLFLGMLLITRPFNGILFGIVILVVFLSSITKKSFFSVVRSLIIIGIGAIPSILFSMLYSYELTGSVFTQIFSVYSPTDTIGFGLRGPEWGAEFTILHAVKNLLFNANSLQDMILGWPFFLSFVFIPFSLACKRNKSLIFTLLIISVQVIGYFFYFGRGTFYGPRYWYEISPFIIILISVGFFELHDQMTRWKLPHTLYIMLVILISFGVFRMFTFFPDLKGNNGMVQIEEPESIKKPAVIFVPGDTAWYNYGKYFTHQSAELNEDIIYARDKGYYPIKNDLEPLENRIIKEVFPNRYLYQLSNGELLEVTE